MRGIMRWGWAVVAAGLLVAGCGGGGDKLSAEECAKEAAKLFDDVNDLEKISERFAELEDKGCTNPQDTAGGNGAPPTFDRDSVEGAGECLALSAEAAAKGVEALRNTGDPAALARLNEELEGLNRRLREECPELSGG